VVRLEVQQWKCRTCKLLYDGISALLGPAFIAVFSYIRFTERRVEDDGTLRMEICTLIDSKLSDYVRKCELRIYRAPGEFYLPTFVQPVALAIAKPC
jgi:hypothetical protein